MIKIILFFLFFLVSCAPNTNRNDFNLSDKMSFDEFKINLQEYAKKNPYPNIDN